MKTARNRRGQRARKSRFRITEHVVNVDWPIAGSMNHVVSGLRVRTHIEARVDRTRLS